MKSHLLDSDDPLVAGQDYYALCGKKVSKAYFVFFFDTRDAGFARMMDGFSALSHCAKCLHADCNRKGKTYLYGLIDGEQAKHLEDSE